MIKGFIPALAVTLAVLGTQAYAQDSDIKIIIDGKEQTSDTASVIINNRLLVPFRAAADGLGASVSWNGSTKSVTCVKDGTTVVLTVGSDVMLKNKSAVRLDCAPVIENGRVLVPVRALSEGLGASVNWYSEERLVSIRTDLTSEAQGTENSEVTISITTQEETYKDKNGVLCFSYNGVLPTVSGANAEKINKAITDNIHYYIGLQADELKADAALASELAAAQGVEPKAWTLNGSAEVTYNDNGKLSILLTYKADGCTISYEGSQVQTLLIPLTFDTTTGELLEIDDITDRKTVVKVKSAIIASINKDDSGYFDNYIDIINKTDCLFYLNGNGTTFFYNAGVLGAGNERTVTYTIKVDN